MLSSSKYAYHTPASAAPQPSCRNRNCHLPCGRRCSRRVPRVPEASAGAAEPPSPARWLCLLPGDPAPPRPPCNLSPECSVYSLEGMFPDACPLTLLSPSKMVPSVHSGPLTPANASEAAANFPHLQDGRGRREESPHPTPPPAQGLVWAIESTVLVTVWLGGSQGATWRSVGEDTSISQERAWAWARRGAAREQGHQSA